MKSNAHETSPVPEGSSGANGLDEAQRARSPKVLIADDDPAVREALKKVLRKAGYEVDVAADGEQALARFNAGHVDLMVLDLGLPIQGGWDDFERITNDNPLLPIIIITGQSSEIRMVEAAGVGALMEKPLDPAQFLQTMKAVLAEPRKVRLRRACGHTQKIRYVPSRSAQFLKRIREQCDPTLRLSDRDDARGW